MSLFPAAAALSLERMADGVPLGASPSFRYCAVTFTRRAGIPLRSEPSSRSVTRTAYRTGMPGKYNDRLLPTRSMSTLGGSFPAAISTAEVAFAPRGSVTVSDAVYVPARVKVNDGFGSVSLCNTVPSRRVMVHAYRSESSSKSTVPADEDRKSTRLNSSHGYISYAVFCLKKKKKKKKQK